jgi:hypothetical protein
MRTLAVLLSSTAVLFAASTARADGALVTVTTKTTGATLLNRATTNGLSVTTQGTNSQKVDFEIDSATGASALLNLTKSGEAVALKIEFTTADAQGREQVTSVCTASVAAVKVGKFTLDDTGFRMNYTLVETPMTCGAPPANGTSSGAATTPAPAVTAPKSVPRLATRSEIIVGAVPTIPKLPPPNVSAAFLTLAAGSNNQGLPKTQLKGASGSAESVLNVGSQSTGGGSARMSFHAQVTQSSSAPTPVLSAPSSKVQVGVASGPQATATTAPFPSGVLSFAIRRLDGTWSSALDVNLTSLGVGSDTFATGSGGGVETTDLAVTSATFGP